MFTSQKYIADFEVINTDKFKNRAVVKTIILGEINEVVIKGVALIKHSRIY